MTLFAPQPTDGRDRFREALASVGNMEHREAAALATDVGIEIDPRRYEILASNGGYPTHLDCPVIEHPGNPLPDLRGGPSGHRSGCRNRISALIARTLPLVGQGRGGKSHEAEGSPALEVAHEEL